jgi:hypothetical protein
VAVADGGSVEKCRSGSEVRTVGCHDFVLMTRTRWT